MISLAAPSIHDDVVCVADIDEVEIAFGHLGVGRVGDELAVDAADAHGAQRAGPRNIADHQRAPSADDAEDVGIVFAVGAEDDGLDLDFVVPAFGKQRADRPVGEAAGEDFLFGRTAFALEVAAREIVPAAAAFSR